MSTKGRRARSDKPPSIAPRSARAGPAEAGTPSAVRQNLWAPGRRWVLVVLAAILLLAALLRGLYLAELAHNPAFGDPAVDGQYHDYWARALATDHWTPPPEHSDPLIRTTPFLRPPGYPYFLSLVYRIAGPGHLGAAIAQMALGVVNCLIGFLLARRWFGEAAALLFAALLGIYWLFIYYEGELLEPVLLVFLFLLLIHALSTWTEALTVKRGLLGGLLLGLAALTRPNILLFGGPVLVWALWVAKRRGNWRGALPALAGLVAGAVLCIAPVTIRNCVAGRDCVLISANSGVNLWIGNNDRANGAFVTAPGIENFDTCFSYPAIVRSVERKTGTQMRYSEVSSFFAGQAWAWMKANPGRELKLLLKKTLAFWGPIEVHHNTVEAAEREHSSVLRATVLTFPVALTLFVIGTAMLLMDSRQDRREKEATSLDCRRQVEVVILILLLLATYFVSFLPFFVAAQYRAPIVPFLLLMGSHAIVRFGILLRERNYSRLAVWLTACAVVGVPASTNFAGHKVDYPKWHYDRGVVYFHQGKDDEAIREYREAIRLSADYADAYVGLGTSLARKGELAPAVEAFRAAARLRPNNSKAYMGLGSALEGLRHFDEAAQAYQTASRCAPDLAETYLSRGVALEACGQTGEAADAYAKAIRLDGQCGRAHARLAVLLFKKGQYDRAWMGVHQARRCGANLPVDFVEALRQKMPEPATRPQH